MTHSSLRSLALVVLALPLFGAGDESQIGFTVETIEFDKHIAPGHLSLRNLSKSKLDTRRDLRVLGDNPRFQVVGKVRCKPGARLTAVQVVVGQVVANHTEVFPMQVHGQTAKLTNIAGQAGAIIDLPVVLNVSRKDTGSLVDLSFNPAREYEKQLKAYVAKGNTAAEYLRETQAFDMQADVNFIAWCKMDPGANSVVAGKTYPGVVSRKVPVTILYEGDPLIVSGPAARAKATTRDAEGGPPVK